MESCVSASPQKSGDIWKHVYIMMTNLQQNSKQQTSQGNEMKTDFYTNNSTMYTISKCCLLKI